MEEEAIQTPFETNPKKIAESFQLLFLGFSIREGRKLGLRFGGSGNFNFNRTLWFPSGKKISGKFTEGVDFIFSEKRESDNPGLHFQLCRK